MEESEVKQKSCLRKNPANVANLQTRSTKNVKFNIPEEEHRWIYTKDKDPKLTASNWKNKKYPSQFKRPSSRFNYALHSLGDVTKTEYFNALRALQKNKMLLNLQFSITREYVEYLWSIKWDEDELTDEETQLQRFREQFEVHFCDTIHVGQHQKPRIIVLIIDSNTNRVPMVALSEHDRLMVVGHPGLIDSLSSLGSLHVVNFIITAFDIVRPGPYHSDFVEEVLDACHGWPALAEKFLECDSKRIEWKQEDAETDLYPYRSNNALSDLYVMLKICDFTKQDLRHLSFMNIGFTEWAKICGAIVIRRETYQFVTKPETDSESRYRPSEFDKKVAAAMSPDDLVVYFPPLISKAQDKDLEELKGAIGNPDGTFAWLAMQRIITKNMVSSDDHVTWGNRFSFMKNSLVGDLQHQISNGFIMLRKVAINPARSRALDQRPRDYVFNFAVINDWYFPCVIWEISLNSVYLSLYYSTSPEWFVKLESLEDPMKQHLLCVFLEVDEDLSIQQLIDKLWQKCPNVLIAHHCRVANETRLEFDNKDKVTQVSLKMTAIIGSIHHARLEQELRERTDVTAVNGAMRITSKELTCLPNDFELIVLLDDGLSELLGRHVYDTLKKFKPMYYKNDDSLANK